jgi:CheY-like chemotaxis protein
MSSLRGARVLVVEDEAMLSLNLKTMLLDMGCVVAGMADKIDDALQIARTSQFDVALLDVNLGGKRVGPRSGSDKSSRNSHRFHHRVRQNSSIGLGIGKALQCGRSGTDA